MGNFWDEKRRKSAPKGRPGADTKLTMKPQDSGPRARKFQDPGTALEALVRWDELSPADLQELRADPRLAARLSTLQSAEEWLEAGGARADACPSAEELYDYAGGPGATPLSAEASHRVDEHLFECTACEELLLTLADAPPSPLVLEPEPISIPAPRRRETPALAPILELAPRPRRRRVQRFALACAATLVVGFSLWMLFDGRDSGLQLPPAPLLRGEAEQALYYPRGPVLENTSGLSASALPLRFELNEVAGAESYRVEVLRHGGGAFESGSRAAEFSGTLDALVLPGRLTAGTYTWRAFATVHGLERELGSRDFEVRADAQLAARLEQAGGSNELMRSGARIRILHEAGDWTDARELARTLPPSAERERYLGQTPGR